MNTIGGQIQSQYLLKIKKILDKDKNGDKFIIVRTKKNIEFMREYGINNEDIKNIIKQQKTAFQAQKMIEIQNMKDGYLNFVHYLRV